MHIKINNSSKDRVTVATEEGCLILKQTECKWSAMHAGQDERVN